MITKKQAERKALAHEIRARALLNHRHNILTKIDALQSKADSLKSKAQKEADMSNHYMSIWRGI